MEGVVVRGDPYGMAEVIWLIKVTPIDGMYHQQKDGARKGSICQIIYVNEEKKWAQNGFLRNANVNGFGERCTVIHGNELLTIGKIAFYYTVSRTFNSALDLH